VPDAQLTSIKTDPNITAEPQQFAHSLNQLSDNLTLISVNNWAWKASILGTFRSQVIPFIICLIRWY
jgi:hypothetical protein